MEENLEKNSKDKFLKLNFLFRFRKCYFKLIKETHSANYDRNIFFLNRNKHRNFKKLTSSEGFHINSTLQFLGGIKDLASEVHTCAIFSTVLESNVIFLRTELHSFEPDMPRSEKKMRNLPTFPEDHQNTLILD